MGAGRHAWLRRRKCPLGTGCVPTWPSVRPRDLGAWTGWALWKALITLAHEKVGGPQANAAARRFGWRTGTRDVIDLVLADHRSSA